jgi:glycerophosphoryl diester phosphodiesterase
VIDIAHQAGPEVLAWAPGSADAARLASAGADALCVDDVPGVLHALAGSHRESPSDNRCAGDLAR